MSNKRGNNSFKKITNPLTIIGLFASIAEVAGTVVLPLVSADLQKIYIWYVMIFPVILVSMFFWTLNKNPLALYGPDDYKDENNYIQIQKALLNLGQQVEEISQSNPDLASELTPIQNTLKEATKALDTAFIEKIYIIDETDKELIEYLSSKPFATVDDIEQNLGLDRGTIVAVLETGILHGFIIKQYAGLKAHYTLNSSAQIVGNKIHVLNCIGK